MNTESLIARCGQRREADLDVVDLDVARLLTRLLLFETYTLDCALRLRDVIELARAIGIDNTCLLLEDGGLRLNARASHLAFPNRDVDRQPLRFHFLLTRHADYADHIKKSYVEITRMEGFKHRRRARLADRAMEALTHRDAEDEGVSALKLFEAELASNSPALRTAVELEIQRRRLHVPPDYEFRVALDAGSHVVDTDLNDKLSLPAPDFHNLVGRGLLGLGGLDMRFEQMETFSAVTAFSPEDFPMMDAKLRQLAAGIDPRIREEQLSRVLDLADLPSLEDVEPSEIDFSRFVDLRNSVEIRDFRAWIAHEAATSADSDIEDRIKDVRARIAKAVGSKVGRAVRLAVTTGVGLVPVVGTAASAALGVLDEFAVDRVIGEPGPVAFFVAEYPSIFEGE